MNPITVKTYIPKTSSSKTAFIVLIPNTSNSEEILNHPDLNKEALNAHHLILSIDAGTPIHEIHAEIQEAFETLKTLGTEFSKINLLAFSYCSSAATSFLLLHPHTFSSVTLITPSCQNAGSDPYHPLNMIETITTPIDAKLIFILGHDDETCPLSESFFFIKQLEPIIQTEVYMLGGDDSINAWISHINHYLTLI